MAARSGEGNHCNAACDTSQAACCRCFLASTAFAIADRSGHAMTL
jgi:hypothetical protein